MHEQLAEQAPGSLVGLIVAAGSLERHAGVRGAPGGLCVDACGAA